MNYVELLMIWKGRTICSCSVSSRELAVRIIKEALCPSEWVDSLRFTHPEGECEQIFVDGQRLMWTIRGPFSVIGSVEELKAWQEERA
jgi:hypothetical protein